MPPPSQIAESALKLIRRARPLLGSVVDIGIGAEASGDSLHSTVDSAFAVIERVQALMSYHDPNSELSRLNRDAAARWQTVEPHTYRVIEAALRFASLSDGAFDPTVAPRLEAWGYLPAIDSPVDAAATWRDVEISRGERVRFSRPLRLDLGGIAKGYAVDLAVENLISLGIEHIIVNAGGDLRVAGPIPQHIELRHPANPSRIAHRVTLQNQALATSAAYFSRKVVRERAVSALVDARGGDAYLGERSISIQARECMTADALTKVVMFAERATAQSVLLECNASALVLA
jgi:FAD:protein FMN transferase